MAPRSWKEGPSQEAINFAMRVLAKKGGFNSDANGRALVTQAQERLGADLRLPQAGDKSFVPAAYGEQVYDDMARNAVKSGMFADQAAFDQAIAKAQKTANTAEADAKKAESDANQAESDVANAYTPTVTVQSKAFTGSQGQIGCPSGAIAIGGGVTVNNESVNVVSSYPAGRNGSQPTGWAVLLSGGGGGQVYVTCLK